MPTTPLWLTDERSRFSDSLKSVERVASEVIERCSKELTRKDEEFALERKKGDEQRHFISNALQEEISKNRLLVNENQKLRDHIRRVDPNFLAETKDAIKNELDEQGMDMPSENDENLQVKYNDLYRKYEENAQKLRYLERKNVVVMQKNRDMKESVRAWQQYSERHYEKLRSKAHENAKTMSKSEPSTDVMTRTPGEDNAGPLQAPIETERSSPLSRSLSPHLRNSVAATLPLPAPNTRNDETAAKYAAVGNNISPEHDLPCDDDLPTRVAHEEALQTSTSNTEQAFRISSSQTTEDEDVPEISKEAPSVTANDDDDVPQFVSERSLKRKRGLMASNELAKRTSSDGTPEHPHRVKEEQCSSPPLQAIPQMLSRKETLDLDEPGPAAIATPRHRRVDPAIAMTKLSEQHSTMVKEEEVEMQGSPFVYVDRHDRLLNRNLATMDEEQAARGPTQNPVIKSRALQPLDPNVRGEVTADEAPRKRVKSGHDEDAVRYRLLAESGDEPIPGYARSGRVTPSMARARFNAKVKGDQTPSKDTKAPQKTPASVLGRSHVEQIPTPPSTLSRPNSRKELGTTSRLDLSKNTKPGVPSAWPTPRNGPAPKPKPRSSIRSRPVSELKLSDFKVNPAYNQGYSYAFRETVRNRSDRACLSGCTRPECCGSAFRVMAEAAPPLPASQEEDLLKDNLGDAYDEMRFTQMSAEERSELVLQARTRQMANKHGKHRHAYERQKSPPGFWRIDFPTTQEEREDREKAAQLEREQVLDRRAEAMRRGGKWIFRDE